jgi:peptidoglycan hydrolase CwlO-like protein
MTHYLTPAAIGILGGLLVQLISVLLQKKQIVVDDNASLRTALMDERKGLVAEIQSLSDRCRKLEDELQAAKSEIIEVKQKNAELEIEIREIRGNDADSPTTDNQL